MKPTTYSIIKTAMAGDETISPEEISIILDCCKNPITRSEATIAIVPTQYLTPNEVAKKMHVSGRTVRRWLSSGILSSKKINGARRIPDTALDNLGKNERGNRGRNSTSAVDRRQDLNGKAL